MKVNLILSAILVFISLWVSGNPKDPSYAVHGGYDNPIPNRTFQPKNTISHHNNANFKPALFTVTNTTLGKKADLAAYSLCFSGAIDVTPGGNKFWNLESKATIFDMVDRQKEPEAKNNVNFKDGNFYKTVYLSVLGQIIKANEYYYLTDDGLYTKGMTIAAQKVIGSGITVSVPAQEVLYTPSKQICYFPMTYDGTTHTIPQYNRTINANVSGASALGIPDGTPISYSATFNDSYKVLAWGGLQLIDYEKPVNALLVQTESKTVGTISINGAKVPQSVLSPLKMTQDSASISVNYSFRNMTYPDNVAEFGLDGDKVTYLTTIKTVK